MIDWFIEHYHWQGLLVHFIGLVLITKLAWWAAFKLPWFRKCIVESC